MNSTKETAIKTFRLPGRAEEFLMHGDFVFRADTKEQAFVREPDGRWIVVRKSFVNDAAWLKILEDTHAR